ncbi:MAG: hypothetical protein HZA78_10040 [Candidatus Schekmanbacteria bacterium]|nr:hypothetical protein [Candidatus Schekmanbacteria bacterium]
MTLGKFRYIPKGRYFPPHTDIKTEGDVRRERNVTLIFIVFCVVIAIGVPFLVNLGKALFAIQPVIY